MPKQCKIRYKYFKIFPKSRALRTMPIEQLVQRGANNSRGHFESAPKTVGSIWNYWTHRNHTACAGERSLERVCRSERERGIFPPPHSPPSDSAESNPHLQCSLHPSSHYPNCRMIDPTMELISRIGNQILRQSRLSKDFLVRNLRVSLNPCITLWQAFVHGYITPCLPNLLHRWSFRVAFMGVCALSEEIQLAELLRFCSRGDR